VLLEDRSHDLVVRYGVIIWGDKERKTVFSLNLMDAVLHPENLDSSFLCWCDWLWIAVGETLRFTDQDFLLLLLHSWEFCTLWGFFAANLNSDTL